MREKIKTVFVGDVAFNTDITPEKTKTSLGGAAYYSAVGAIAAQNRESLLHTSGIVAPIGSDFDLQKIASKNIDIQGVEVLPDGKTCHFILTQYADNTRDFKAERGVAEKVQTNIFPDQYQDAKYVHLATSLPQNYLIWIDFLSHTTSATISADAFESFAKEFPLETIEALNRVGMIFLNDEEANILERKGTLRTDVPWVLKHGGSGASYLADGKEISVKAKKVSAIETTGAGDTLPGAFLTLLSANYEIEQALKIAVDIASKSITDFGVEHLAKN
mgnify:CR=1 FL=1